MAVHSPTPPVLGKLHSPAMGPGFENNELEWCLAKVKSERTRPPTSSRGWKVPSNQTSKVIGASALDASGLTPPQTTGPWAPHLAPSKARRALRSCSVQRDGDELLIKPQ